MAGAGVVAVAGAGAAAEDRLCRVVRGGESGAADAAGHHVGAPAIAAHAAAAAVAAAAAAAVVLVGGVTAAVVVAVGAAAAGIAGRAAGKAAVGIALVAGAVVGLGGTVVDEAGGAGDALALGGVEEQGRDAAVIRVGKVVAVAAAGGLAAAAAEAERVDARRAAVQGEGAVHVDDQDAADGAGPAECGETGGRAQRRAGVLRHANDLEAALAGGAGGVGIGVGVHQHAAVAAAKDRHGAAGDGAGGDDVLHDAGVVQVAGAFARACAGAIVGAVVGVDSGVLHLDHQQQVAGGDGGRRAARRADGDRGGAGGGGGRAGIIRIDDTAQGRRAVPARRAARLRPPGLAAARRQTAPGVARKRQDHAAWSCRAAAIRTGRFILFRKSCTRVQRPKHVLGSTLLRGKTAD